jgi:hypothetical protein
MAQTQETDFACTNCGAQYKVVRVEGPSAVGDRELSCVNCGEVLKAREDEFLLKYFLIAHSEMSGTGSPSKASGKGPPVIGLRSCWRLGAVQQMSLCRRPLCHFGF